MRGCFAALTLSVLACGTPALASDKPCELHQIADIDVLMDRNGGLLVPVEIEGQDGLMQLALNSGPPWLYPSSLELLGLQKRMHAPERESHINGHKVEKELRVPSTVLGNANFTGWDYLLDPTEPVYRLRFAGKPVFGVMTSIFMNSVDVELNLAENKIRLFKPNKCRQAPVYWGGEYTQVQMYVDASGLLLFPLELEGQRFETSLNTAGRFSIISSEAVKRYLGFDETAPGVEHQPLGADNEIASFRAMSLTAKGLDVKNARVRIRKMPACRPSSSDRNSDAIGCQTLVGMTPFSIGTDLMRRLRIFISTADGKIYFSRAEPAGGSAAADGAHAAAAGAAPGAAGAPGAADAAGKPQ